VIDGLVWADVRPPTRAIYPADDRRCNPQRNADFGDDDWRVLESRIVEDDRPM
jgi:hypothetical protein